MINYNVCPCNLCGRPLRYTQLREGVFWAPRQTFQSFWARFWDEGGLASDELVFAHRTCWKNLSERKRELIRVVCDDEFVPRSLGQLV